MHKFLMLRDKLVVGSAAVLGSFMAFAEGASNPTVTQPVDILTNAQTGFTTLMGDALPIIGGIVVSGLTLWAVFKLLRLVMKAFGFGAR